MKQALGLFARCNYLVYFKPKSQRSDTSMLCERYRVIVNACGRPILVAFWGNPCPPIFIPTNVHTTHIVYTSIYSIFIKIVPITRPTKLRPHKPKTVWLSTNNNNNNKMTQSMHPCIRRTIIASFCIHAIVFIAISQ